MTSIGNPQKGLARKIDICQDIEGMWHEEGRRLRGIYKKKYGEETN